MLTGTTFTKPLREAIRRFTTMTGRTLVISPGRI
jgi:hypothetical protein